MQIMFGIIRAGNMVCNSYGRAVEHCWVDLPNHYECRLDEFVIMPNHIHGIIIIPDSQGTLHQGNRNIGASPAFPVPAGLNPLVREEVSAPREGVVREKGIMKKPHSITEIVRGFKTFSAATINRQRVTPGASIWMRSFHDHVIRSVSDIDRVREYA